MGEEDKIKMIEELTQEVLQKLGVTAKISVFPNEDKCFKIDISGDDLGALIGFHGEGLSALQLFLNLAVHKKIGEWQRVLVDVGGYRQEREQKIYELAQRTADRVRFLQTPVTLTPMPAFERRLVHIALAGDKTVETESVGEGGERRVVIKPAPSA